MIKNLCSSILAFSALVWTCPCEAKLILEENQGLQLYAEVKTDENNFQYRTDYYAKNLRDEDTEVWMVLVDGSNLEFDLVDEPQVVKAGAEIHLGYTQIFDRSKPSRERYVFQFTAAPDAPMPD